MATTKSIRGKKAYNPACITLGCYNVKGAMRNAMYLDTLLNNNDLDILVVSEHWLYKDSLSFLDSLNKNYISHGVSDSTLNPLDPYRRGKGGVSILWNIKLTSAIKLIDCDSDRLIAISIQLENRLSLTIIGVYLPDSHYGLDAYKDCLDKVKDMYFTYCDFSEVIILGDFNGQILGPSSVQEILVPRHKELQEAVVTMELVSAVTLGQCKGPGYTFNAFAGGPRTVIDHICLKHTKVDLIQQCTVLEENSENLSDHLPVVIKLNLSPLNVTEEDNNYPKYQWKKISSEQRRKGYSLDVNQQLADLILPEIENEQDIEEYYKCLIDTMLISSNKHVPKSKFERHLKPFWKAENYILKELHNSMRLRRAEWKREGQPRGYGFHSYTAYKDAKRQFRKKMRHLAQKAEHDFYTEIERAATVDQNKFWKLINSKRKKRGNSVYELKVNGTVLRDPADIRLAWVDHFSRLYTEPTEIHDKTEKQFIAAIDEEYETIMQQSSDELDDITSQPVDEEELERIIRNMKTGKAGGTDRVTNEHIKYGGKMLKKHLVHLYNGIIKVEKIPKSMKRGILITLHKGSRKYEDDRRNHRGLTLLNTLYKILETLKLQRIKVWMDNKGKIFPNDQQGAYQKQLCSTMTSFNFHETISYHIERDTKVFTGLLDTTTAFDTVWHKGLFVKLHRLGITGKTWRLICQMYSNMETAVMYQGKLSEWISVQRSVRQGGVLSPWLYMVYIDELLTRLKNSGHGASIGNLYCGSPTQADDISLISTTAQGLQEMINIVNDYAKQWRYELNPTKSKIMIFDRQNKRQQSQNVTWTLNGKPIEITESEKHVGIRLNAKSDSRLRTKEACNKGRNTLMSLLNIGVKSDGMNPITSAHLMKCIVFPRALFGSELWNNLSINESKILERMLTFCCKTIQGLDKRCRSDMCTSMCGLARIQAMTDTRKLLFLGRLIGLPENILAKKVLTMRILQFVVFDCTEGVINRQQGYVTDIVSQLQKYNLANYLTEYITSGFQEFPAQTRWKIIVKKAVQEYEQSAWKNRTSGDQDFELFAQIQDKCYRPAYLWTFAKKKPEYLEKCKNMAKFAVRTPTCFIEKQLCCYCGLFFNDIYFHVAMACYKCYDERENYWQQIMDVLPVEFSVSLFNKPDDEMYCAMLGGNSEALQQNIESKNNYEAFFELSVEFFHTIAHSIY